MQGLLLVVASKCGLVVALECGLVVALECGIIVDRGLQGTRASGVVVQGLRCVPLWDLPRPGIEPVFPTLAGRFLCLYHRGSPLCLICPQVMKILSCFVLEAFISI